MRTFVCRLSNTDGELLAETYSGKGFPLTSEELVKGVTTNPGHLNYYVVNTLSYGKIRFVLTDERQERDLVVALGLASEALGTPPH